MSQQAVSVQHNEGFWKKIEVFVVTKPLHKELFFLATLSATLFLLIALLSFHPFDASLFSVSVPAQETANFAGSIGANVSAAMVHWFGIAAFILPLLLITNTFLVVFKNAKVLWPAYLLSSMLLYLATAYFLALIFDKLTMQMVILT